MKKNKDKVYHIENFGQKDIPYGRVGTGVFPRINKIELSVDQDDILHGKVGTDTSTGYTNNLIKNQEDTDTPDNNVSDSDHDSNSDSNIVPSIPYYQKPFWSWSRTKNMWTKSKQIILGIGAAIVLLIIIVLLIYWLFNSKSSKNKYKYEPITIELDTSLSENTNIRLKRLMMK